MGEGSQLLQACTGVHCGHLVPLQAGCIIMVTCKMAYATSVWLEPRHVAGASLASTSVPTKASPVEVEGKPSESSRERFAGGGSHELTCVRAQKHL